MSLCLDIEGALYPTFCVHVEEQHACPCPQILSYHTTLAVTDPKSVL